MIVDVVCEPRAGTCSTSNGKLLEHVVWSLASYVRAQNGFRGLKIVVGQIVTVPSGSGFCICLNLSCGCRTSDLFLKDTRGDLSRRLGG